MNPGGAGGGPGDQKIRELAADHTAAQIGEMYGVARSSAEYWMRRAGLLPATGERTNYRDMLPWDLRVEDSNDNIVRALRAISKQRRGMDLSVIERNRAQKLLDHCSNHNVVVSYDRNRPDPDNIGARFVFVPRDPSIDTPDLPIRKP